MKFQGAHMGQTVLKRIIGSTGTAIRDKTSGEGNPGGATRLWVQDFWLDGNGTAGDGLDIGNQAAQLNGPASVSNVYVANFPSGTGITINGNAVSCSYLWSIANSVGIKTLGGACSYFGLWLESNTSYDLHVTSFDNFYHVQVEPVAKSADCIFVDTGSVNFFGVHFGLQGNVGDLLHLADGRSELTVHGLKINTNGYTFTNAIKHAWGGTGSSLEWVPQYTYQTGLATTQFNAGTGAYVQQDTALVKIGGTQVVGARVVDARADDVANSGDATTDGLIDALRDAMIAHGLIAAA